MKTKLTIHFVTLGPDGGLHMHTYLKVNGKNAIVVVDTGASRTVFDSERINRFVKKGTSQKSEHVSSGLGTSTMESFQVDLATVQLGKITMAGYRTHLLDLSHVNNAYKAIGIEEVDGVLGSDMLNDLKAVIDYNKKVIYLNQKKAKKEKAPKAKKEKAPKAKKEKAPKVKKEKAPKVKKQKIKKVKEESAKKKAKKAAKPQPAKKGGSKKPAKAKKAKPESRKKKVVSKPAKKAIAKALKTKAIADKKKK